MTQCNITRELSIIGYWSNPDVSVDQSRGYPDPRDLRRDWHGDERRAVIKHLRQGTVFRLFAGSSLCRICGQELGSKEYTDGVYAWPEGLVHYVEAHDVQLLDTFVAACQSSNREPPSWLASLEPKVWLESGPEVAIPIDAEGPPTCVVDETAWLDWAALNTPARPSADAISLEAANQVCRRLSHPTWHAEVNEVNGRWCLQLGDGDVEMRVYLQKCCETILEQRLLSLRPPDATSILDPARANVIAAEYDGVWGAARVLTAHPNGAWFIWVKTPDLDWPAQEKIFEILQGEQRFGWAAYYPSGAHSFITPPADEPRWRWLLSRQREDKEEGRREERRQ